MYRSPHPTPVEPFKAPSAMHYIAPISLWTKSIVNCPDPRNPANQAPISTLLTLDQWHAAKKKMKKHIHICFYGMRTHAKTLHITFAQFGQRCTVWQIRVCPAQTHRNSPETIRLFLDGKHCHQGMNRNFSVSCHCVSHSTTVPHVVRKECS